MGVVVLGERLRRLQWVALGLAAVAVRRADLDYGRPPWVALVLAFSFGTYGLAKKQAGVDAVESLTFETLVLAPVALAYLVWLGLPGRLELLRARRRPRAAAHDHRHRHRRPAAVASAPRRSGCRW